MLEQLQVSLLATTYQAGKLTVFRTRQGRVSLLLRSFENPMGLALSTQRLAVGTRSQIWILENDHRLSHQIDAKAGYDACFLPRRSHVTGDINVHEIAWGSGLSQSDVPASDDQSELWIVNTRFSCLCTLHQDYSFVPRWRPNFISELAGDDRCHLNGLAMRKGRPSVVSLLAASDQPHGWRDQKATGGCLVDVASGEILASELCMPHSPRWHRGALWLLDSGTGQLLCVEPASGRCLSVARFPGYARGLAFCRQYAFVGLSRIRETSTFSGIPIADQRDQLRCGVWVIDLDTGREVGLMEFQGDVTEVFDVQLMHDRTNPTAIGIEKDTLQTIFSIPPEVRWEQVPNQLTSTTATQHQQHVDAPGTILQLDYVGPSFRLDRSRDVADVWLVTYSSRVDGGCRQSAQLFLPRGEAPSQGWPVSIWCHGLGDPAEQLRRWPCASAPWRKTRGQLAGCWAQHGIATLTPWLPGDGPSEPFATYSPFSLSRNLLAISDAVSLLRKLAAEDVKPPIELRRELVQLDLDNLVLRSDCASSPLLISAAAQPNELDGDIHFKALVADGFQTSILHNERYLGPRLNQLSPLSAAAIRSIWLRVLLSLFADKGWPANGLVSDRALELFNQPTVSSHGHLPLIMNTKLVPPSQSDLAPQVVARVGDDLQREPTGADIQQWMYAPNLLEWAHSDDTSEMLRHEFYRQHLASADPFFAENITPFAAEMPLLVVAPQGDRPSLLPGMPTWTEMCEHLTLPKIETLRSWGWDVRFLAATAEQGTSFTGGAAQQWVLDQLPLS